MSLYITKAGHVYADRVEVNIFPEIERGRMDAVNGIVVHQTGAPTAQATFNSYGDKRHGTPNGAHFLIDKDGTIYQTASLYRATNHVGYLQSRCVITMQCTATELKDATRLERIKGNNARAIAIHRNESNKSWPDRYPSNVDSIGIEIVSKPIAHPLPNGGKKVRLRGREPAAKRFIGMADKAANRHFQADTK